MLPGAANIGSSPRSKKMMYPDATPDETLARRVKLIDLTSHDIRFPPFVVLYNVSATGQAIIEEATPTTTHKSFCLLTPILPLKNLDIWMMAEKLKYNEATAAAAALLLSAMFVACGGKRKINEIPIVCSPTLLLGSFQDGFNRSSR
jgi:hypothetical protein